MNNLIKALEHIAISPVDAIQKTKLIFTVAAEYGLSEEELHVLLGNDTSPLLAANQRHTGILIIAPDSPEEPDDDDDEPQPVQVVRH